MKIKSNDQIEDSSVTDQENKGVIMTDQTKLNDELLNSQNEVKNLTDKLTAKDTLIADKDTEIKKLTEQLEKYHQEEKETLVDSFVELKIKYRTNDLESFFKEEDETKKTKILNDIKKSLMEKDVDSINFAISTLSAVNFVEKVEDKKVKDKIDIKDALDEENKKDNSDSKDKKNKDVKDELDELDLSIRNKIR